MTKFTKKGEPHYVPAYYDGETREEFLLRQIEPAYNFDFMNVNLLNASLLKEHSDIKSAILKITELPEEKIDEIAMHFNILDIIKTCRNAVKNMEIEDSEMAKLLKKLDDKEWEEHHNFCAPPQKQGHLLFVKEINELTQIQKLLTKNTAMKKTWEKWYEAAIAHDVLINEGKSHDDPEVLKFGETAEKLEKRMCKILKKMEGIVKGDN